MRCVLQTMWGKEKLSRHLRIHHTPKVFLCKPCGENIHNFLQWNISICRVSKQLRRCYVNHYLRIHTGEGPYRSMLCIDEVSSETIVTIRSYMIASLKNTHIKYEYKRLRTHTHCRHDMWVNTTNAYHVHKLSRIISHPYHTQSIKVHKP